MMRDQVHGGHDGRGDMVSYREVRSTRNERTVSTILQRHGMIHGAGVVSEGILEVAEVGMESLLSGVAGLRRIEDEADRHLDLAWDEVRILKTTVMLLRHLDQAVQAQLRLPGLEALSRKRLRQHNRHSDPAIIPPLPHTRAAHASRHPVRQSQNQASLHLAALPPQLAPGM